MLETIVFGRRAGISAAKYVKKASLGYVSINTLDAVRHEIAQILENKGREKIVDIRSDLQSTMTEKCGIFRDKKGLTDALHQIHELKERINDISIIDKGMIFNTELIGVLELRNMLDFSEVIVAGALAREESRGAHFRCDFPQRDDDKWLMHTLAYPCESGCVLKYKPVTITMYEPEKRVY
jgi:succinate dehydrogenase / fumarate reductase flavoprotein subunit